MPQPAPAPAAPVREGEQYPRATEPGSGAPLSNASRRTLRVVDENGQPVPELIVAARSLDQALSLTAQLKTTIVPPDDQLRGLITTQASLQVSIMRDGDIVDAFTLQSSGAGFTQDASTQQARERLATALTQRLAHVRP